MCFDIQIESLIIKLLIIVKDNRGIMVKIHTDILEYLLKYQNERDIYLNRTLVLKHRMITEYNHSQDNFINAINELLGCGYIQHSSRRKGQLYISDEGENALFDYNKILLNNNRSKRFFDAHKLKFKLLAFVITSAISIFGLYLAFRENNVKNNNPAPLFSAELPTGVLMV